MERGSDQYTEQGCLEALRGATEILEETPTKSEYRTTGLSPSPEKIVEICGSWRLAITKAGLQPRSQERYTKEDCIRALQNFAETYGEEPTMDSYKKSGYKPAAGTIAKRFGSWSKAKSEAEVLDDDEDISIEEEVDQTFEMLDNAELGRRDD
ncbi:homing endonuclease associated repeat-containing protein [Haloferax gibbonsii]|nr:hypothetical protein [Haloferax gibbonsii]